MNPPASSLPRILPASLRTSLLATLALATTLPSLAQNATPSLPRETSSPTPPPFTQPGLDVRAFGAVGDGKTDDTAAFQKAAAACLDNGRALLIPAGTYLVRDKITAYRWTKEKGRGSISVIGESPVGSVIRFEAKDPNSVLFEHAEWFICKNLGIEAAHQGNDFRGVAFATPPNTQSAWSVYESIRLRGKFKYGWFNRFTMHDQWRNVQSHGPLCHFMFATSNDMNSPLATPAKGWNGGDQGWFHNLGTMDGVICDGGEVAIAGAVMQFNFVQLTAQGQQTGDGANNRILPKGDPGTGLYLTGVAPNPYGALRGNTIGAYYTEVTQRPIYARNAGVISGSSAFFQGNAKTPYPAAIVLDNTRLTFNCITTRQPFGVLYQGTNNSLLSVDLVDGQKNFKVDATSKFKLLNP